MTSDRLTRQELSWLLAQEARTAAEFLREGVTKLSPEPAPTPAGEDDVVSTLDALEDAMRTLASLNTSGNVPNSRRGRIDLASLLFELTPAARVSLQPGSGTEVFGDEGELRRMLQVMLSFGTTATAGKVSTEDTSNPTTIRREGDTVRVSVTLGPDSSATGATEQAWLHRMAVRYGGALQLGGGKVTLALPANTATELRELAELRRELAVAQEKGESSARELATMFAQRRSILPPASARRKAIMRLTDDPLMFTVRLLTSLAQRPEQTARRVQALAALGQLMGPNTSETAALFNVRRVVTAALESVGKDYPERHVAFSIDAPDENVLLRPRTCTVLIALLLEQAMLATADGGAITVGGRNDVDGLWLWVEDEGPLGSSAGQLGFWPLDADGTLFGRLAGAELLCADALARSLGGVLEFATMASGRAGVRIFLPTGTTPEPA